MENEKALIAVERLNPVEIFQNGGMKPILQEIEKKATSIVADVETDEGRKDIASIAYRVARSKTLIDDMGKALVSDWKKKAKVVDTVRKEARDFLDELKDRVRTPLTEWEAVEAKRQAEEEAKERAIIQGRIDELQKYGVILPFVEVATFNEAEYDAMLGKAIDEYAAEQERIEVARLDRVEEAKRLADGVRKLKIRAKIQSLHEVYITPSMTSSNIEELIENYKVEMLPGLEFDEFQSEAIQIYQKALTVLTKAHGDKVDQEEHETKVQKKRDLIAAEQKAAQDKINEANRKIEAEKQAFEDEKKAEKDRKDREVFEAQAKEDARIKAEKDAKEKVEREERERIEKKAAEQKEVERQESLRPDREKLRAYFDSILSVPEPELGKEAKVILDWLVKELMKLDDRLSEHLGEL